MDCNREEAIRAMVMAESKMEKRDFEGAKKTALKAQQLYPDLLNISQMILVCDVHCASQSKGYGNEIDWYGVLQVEPTADEAVIKKQFRKLALSLHPDKNKFSGAADAFKMIGEAQKVLLDREKRMVYDSKRKAAGRYQPSYAHTHHGSRQTNARGHPWFQSTFVSSTTSQFVNQQQGQQPPGTRSGGVNDRATFWTICPFCSVQFQYYRDVLNKTLCCQKCKKEFTGYEMNPPGGIPQTNSNQPVFPQHKGAAKKDTTTAVPQSTSKRSFSKTEDGVESFRNKNKKSKMFNAGSSNKFKDSKRNGRKRKMSTESSESCDSETSSDSTVNIEEGGGNLVGQNFGSYSDQNLRRSTRSKQRVSYEENLSDDEDMSKRSKFSGYFSTGVEEGSGSSVQKEAGLAAGMEESKKETKRKKNSSPDEIFRNRDNKTEETFQNVAVPKDEKGNSAPQDYEYPDPDFSDFEKERKEECFAVGQLWAVYDTLDAMPRFYALIRKILSPAFKLRITWLEPDPDDEGQSKWVTEGLPASCGKFILGHSEITTQHQMFSHLVYSGKSIKIENLEIYPRTGEIWALYKGWDINWHSDPQRKKDYEYEFVEVLSDYAHGSDARVAYLGKLKGFACLFCRIVKNGIDSFVIPAKHIYRFSHKIPSFKMSGEERLDVPKGSFELDPASLPSNLDEIDVLTAFSMAP